MINRLALNIGKPNIKCTFSHMLSDICDNRVVIVITGDQSIMDDVDDLQEIVDDKKVPIFFIRYSGTLHALKMVASIIAGSMKSLATRDPS